MAANTPDSSLTNILQTNLGTWLPQYPATTHGQRPCFNTLANTKILVKSKVKSVHSKSYKEGIFLCCDVTKTLV